jgi:ferredoxin--NADP+ reductase
MKIDAPLVAQKAQPGQFVMLRIDERSERIPLTVYDTDAMQGTVSIVFQEVGKTTLQLCKLQKGDFIQDFVGPLGKPSEIRRYGKVLCVGGGVGVVEIYPVAKAMSAAGNEVTFVMGFRTKDLVILEEEMKSVSSRLFMTTDDGSYGVPGFVTGVVSRLLSEERFDIAFAVGPVPMMKGISAITRKYGLRTIVSLNSIMVDGTGMCGSCRAVIGGEVKFVCVDGPDFDADLVDFDGLMMRQKRFVSQEKISLEQCKITG